MQRVSLALVSTDSSLGVHVCVRVCMCVCADMYKCQVDNFQRKWGEGEERSVKDLIWQTFNNFCAHQTCYHGY